MFKAIEVLMTEHRLIENVLGSLGTLAGELRAGAALERFRAVEFGQFFSRFADAVHHGKEEDLLFESMVRHGFPRESGPLAVMLHEHTIGRRLVATIKQIGSASGPVSDAEKGLFVESAGAYPDMLLAHIQKEDQILYPMAMQVLPSAELDRLAEEYDRFEEKVVGRGAIDELHGLAAKLVAAYPFDPAAIGAASAGMGCQRR